MAKKNMCKPLCTALACLLVVACSSSLSEQKAEAIALEFLSESGVFYTSNDSGDLNVTQYSSEILLSEQQEAGWVFLVKVTTEVDGAMKSGYISVGVDQEGEAHYLGKS